MPLCSVSSPSPTPPARRRTGTMAESDHPVTLGEVSRHLDSISSELRGMRSKMDDLTSWPDIKRVEDGLKARHDADVLALTRRIATLEGWQTWAGRLVLGAVILAILGVVIASKAGAL
nr:hypothetical protein [Arthrobacter woluwensis]